jgi:hypothetical protein
VGAYDKYIQEVSILFASSLISLASLAGLCS